MDWKQGRGDSAPSIRPAPKYRIIIPKPGDPTIVRILDHTFLGVDAHWIKGSGSQPSRTIGCIKGEGCPCETVALPNKWHAYLGVSSYRSRECGILSLTQRGQLALADVAGDEASLRGLKISVRRATDHPSSRMLIHVLVNDQKEPCPPAFDLMPTLASVYGPAWADYFMRRCMGKDGAS